MSGNQGRHRWFFPHFWNHAQCRNRCPFFATTLTAHHPAHWSRQAQELQHLNPETIMLIPLGPTSPICAVRRRLAARQKKGSLAHRSQQTDQASVSACPLPSPLSVRIHEGSDIVSFVLLPELLGVALELVRCQVLGSGQTASLCPIASSGKTPRGSIYATVP